MSHAGPSDENYECGNIFDLSEDTGDNAWLQFADSVLEDEKQMYDPAAAPRRLRRAEAVLRQRTGRIAIILEQSKDYLNFSAIIRTCESFGVQNVCVIRNSEVKNKHLVKKIHKGSQRWLTVRKFETAESCVQALRSEGWTIWATNLDPHSVLLCASTLPSPAGLSPSEDPTNPPKISSLPDRVAVVMGREMDGVSPEMLAMADLHVYLPMFGFTESFNLSVATALVLSELFHICPEARGDMSEQERSALRRLWFERLGKTDLQRAEYAKWAEVGRSVLPEPELRLNRELRQPRVAKKTLHKMAKSGDRPVVMMKTTAPKDTGSTAT